MKMRAPAGVTCSSIVDAEGKIHRLVPDKAGECKVPDAAANGAARAGWVTCDNEYLQVATPGASVTMPTLAGRAAPKDYPRAAGAAPLRANHPEQPVVKIGVRKVISSALKSIAEFGQAKRPEVDMPPGASPAAMPGQPSLAGAPPEIAEPGAPPSPASQPPNPDAPPQELPICNAPNCGQRIPPEAPSVEVPELGICHLGCAEGPA